MTIFIVEYCNILTSHLITAFVYVDDMMTYGDSLMFTYLITVI